MTEIAVYYFPGFHPDPRLDAWHGKGWTEWELLKAARPRFDGHHQPIIPEWGYFDESLPESAEREIDLAADHGVTAFLYDWYWYDGPFLEGALRRGFLAARNRERLKFALMWANHDWLNIQPAPAAAPYQRLLSGQIDRSQWDALAAHVVEHFMGEDNYLRIGGKPLFTIYDPAQLIAGLGGIAEAQSALRSFEDRARAAGHGGVHFNAIVWTQTIIPSELQGDLQAIVDVLGFESVTSYVWLHHIDFATAPFPMIPYVEASQAAYAAWEECRERFAVPYFPNVTVGWDSSPRTVQTDVFEKRIYPWISVMSNNTPAAIEDAVARAVSFAGSLETPIVTVNAWNEWTEGSYLLPDAVDGTQRIEALGRGLGRRV
jgi:hypothetical protein